MVAASYTRARTRRGLNVCDALEFARSIAREERERLAELNANELRSSNFEFNPTAPPEWFHAGQLRTWGSLALEIVIVAGTQGGKTATQAPWLLREIRRCAPLIKKLGGGKFIYAGPTLTLLQSQAIPAFTDLFEGEHQLGKTVHGNKPKFVFSAEGSKRLLGFDAPVTINFAYTNDSSNLESMTALGGVWDEAGQKENKQASYRAYNRRLKAARSTTFESIRQWITRQGLETEFAWWIKEFYDTEGPAATFGRRLWGTTPYEWGWFKSFVVDKAIDRQSGFEHFNFPSWLNPLVSKEECEKELENGMPLWEWEMMYEGLFTKPAGIIYDCYDSKLNEIPRFPIPEEWPRHVGVDFGNNNTAAVKLAEELERVETEDGSLEWGKPTGRLIAYELYKKRNDDVEAHATALMKGEKRTLSGAGGSHQESGWRQSFRFQAIPLSDPLPNVRDVEVGIQCVYGTIKRRELLVFSDLMPLIEQIQQYARELDDDGEPKEKISEKAKYHYLDALRYIVAKLRPPKPKQDASDLKPFVIRI